MVSFIVVAGCGAPSQPPSPSGGPVTDHVSLVDNLRAAGAEVEPAGNIEQPFFPVQGQVISVDGEDVQVFEFPDADSAEEAASSVSPDGSAIGTTMVSWVAPPHFYRAGRVIVIYVGSNQEAISVLENVLGGQFAGR
jgi:hypothetical protein